MGKRSKKNFPNGLLPKGHSSLGEEIDLSSRFCYFLDLNNWKPNYESGNIKAQTVPIDDLKQHKQNLFDNAKRDVVYSIQSQINLDELENGEETIKTAVEFLRQVAENERNKEVKIIKQYANHLRQNLPKILKNNSSSDINQLIKRLEDFSENPENMQNYNMETFYEELTICINTIRKSAEEVKDRITQILSNNRQTYADLTRDNMAFRFGSDVDGLIKNVIGIKTKSIEGSFSNRLQSIVIEYIIELIDNGKIDLNNFWPSLIGLLADFGNYIQKATISKRMSGALDDLANIDDTVLKQLFLDYLNTPSYFLQSLNTNSQHLAAINETLTETLGIKQLTNQKEIEERNELIKKRKNRKIKGTDMYVNTGAKKLSTKFPDLYKVISQTDFIKWNNKNSDSVKQGRAGSLYELIKQAISPALKVKGHAATDIITVNLGTLEGDLNYDLEDLIFKNLNDFKKSIENFEKKTRENALNDLKEDYTAMNKELEDSLHEIDSMLNLSEQQNLFIYHESLKLYVRIEEHKTTQFEGRELQVLNALDRIYSMNGFGGLMLPDEEIMYNLVLNLSNYAMGKEIRNDVEQYLSIFAGMLMFDDMRNMAKELAYNAVHNMEFTEYSSLQNIHLYLLNDTYVPGSMVLSYIYKALAAGVNHITISSKNAARVKINTSEADSEIQNYLETHPYGSKKYKYDDWNTERDKIAQGTKIQIIFMSAFITFLRDLQSHFN